MGSSPLARGTRSLRYSGTRNRGLIPARAGNTNDQRQEDRKGWAHPRSRGEHVALEGDFLLLQGSSPLARGTLKHRPHIKAAPGLIPARAGNTKSGKNECESVWAHPRSRGEHPFFAPSGTMLGGSSPLARGTHSPLCARTRRFRLIPARAGNTPVAPSERSPYGAHPRSRGEHSMTGRIRCGCWGSSPLARGTPVGYPSAPCRAGLIPARAGNTHVSCRCVFPLWAHPRSRGEHNRQKTSRTHSTGSSPLARGTRPPTTASTPPTGLIPARAGNTEPRLVHLQVGRAHPRSRGEHQPRFSAMSASLGSSPLARGTQVGFFGGDGACGLIPARAGNTLKRNDTRGCERAHPRSRGEHVEWADARKKKPGSSPLARGTHRSH